MVEYSSITQRYLAFREIQESGNPLTLSQIDKLIALSPMRYGFLGFVRRNAESDPTYKHIKESSMIFRQLDRKETEEFRQHAQENPPENMKWWDIYHPVCREVWVQQGYADAVGEYQYGDSLRGIIDSDTGEVLCLGCGEERENQVTLYHINIAPYSQTCWECGEMFFHGWIPTELFPKVREMSNDKA